VLALRLPQSIAQSGVIELFLAAHLFGIQIFVVVGGVFPGSRLIPFVSNSHTMHDNINQFPRRFITVFAVPLAGKRLFMMKQKTCYDDTPSAGGAEGRGGYPKNGS
jgi:hypothetical protein